MNNIDDLTLDQKRALLAELLQEKAKKASESKSTFSLSHGQRALWFHCQLVTTNAAYNVIFAARIRSDLDIAALRRTFQALVDRHPMLRTTFLSRSGKPVQQVHQQTKVHFQETNASTWDQDSLNKAIINEGYGPFNLEQGPLLRVRLFTQSTMKHTIVCTMHHLIGDYWSFGILLDEIRVLYHAETTGIKASLPPPRFQYSDFVRWEADMLASPEGERHWAYWQKKLAGELPVLNLPVDRPRPPVRTYHGAEYPFEIDKDLTRRLKTTANAEGATLYMILLASFQVLLYRYTGQEDILVGCPVIGRNRTQFERIVGYFINVVVMRSDLPGKTSFSNFLRQVRQTVLEAIEHQDYPFPLMVEKLQPNRDPSDSPLFRVMFNMPIGRAGQEVKHFGTGKGGARIDLGELEIELFNVEQRGTLFDIVLVILEAEDVLYASLQYNTLLYDVDTIARMAEHFRTLLGSIVANPTQAIPKLPILTHAERHQLLTDWNSNRVDYPRDSCFQELFEDQVERTPDTIALVFAEKQLSYRELNQRGNCLARLLVEHEVGPDTIVAVISNRGFDLLTAIIGIFKAGGVYLPLDPRHPPQRLFQVLSQSEVPLVLAANGFMSVLSQALARQSPGKSPRVLKLEDLPQQNPSEENLPSRCTPNDLAYVIYTSGSTGLPKGVMIEHQGMLNHLYAKISDLKLTDGDIVAQTASQCFDISLWQFLAVLLVGGRVGIFSDEVAHDPRRLPGKVEREGISIVETVPSLLRVLVEEAARGGETHPGLSSLRWMIATGEALPPELCRQWCGNYPNIPLMNAYGPTECSDDVTHYPIYRTPAPGMINMPIGRPLANTLLYILDSQLQPVPIGICEELWVGGVGVGRGYLNDVKRTAEVFISNPFVREPGACLFKTGDRARYLPDGNIEFLGRVDYQVKIRGFRIELGEIEAALAQHPEVREVVVLVREDVPGDKRLVAYVASDREQTNVSHLRGFLKEKLPGYMVPSAFVILKALPLTPNGKIDSRALSAPGSIRTDSEVTFVAPRTPVEAALAKIWAKVIGVDRVGIHDDFFALGGHSLLAAQIVSQVQKVLKVTLPLHSFFSALTVAEMAQAIEMARQTGPTASTVNSREP